jgi:hypothetical protein
MEYSNTNLGGEIKITFKEQIIEGKIVNIKLREEQIGVKGILLVEAKIDEINKVLVEINLQKNK